MRPRFRSNLVAAGTLTFAFLALAGSRGAEAGFCQGRREGIRLYVEYLGRSIEKRVLDSFFDLEMYLDEYSEFPVDFALWNLHLQARASLSKILTEVASERTAKQPSYEDLLATIKPLWSKTASISSTLRQMPSNPESACDDTLRDIVTNWSNCQSLVSRNPNVCDLLGGIDPRLRKGCRLDMARMLVLYGGNCHGKLADQAADILGMSPEKMHATCEILSKRQASRCKEFGEFEPFCLALCNGDESACRSGQLSEKISGECVKDLHVFETIKGKETITQFEKIYPNSSRLLMLRAMFGKQDCLSSALDEYDRRSNMRFSLRSQFWPRLSGRL